MAALASAEIIAELERTVRVCPPARCALIMRRVTELLVGNADRLEGAQFEVFDDILIRLMDRVEVNDLARLSDALAYLAPARLKIVRRLAHHEQAVSSQASREQSLGVGEINSAVVQLDTVTQQNASTSEETAESARLLSSQAASLKTAVDQLLATIHGEGKPLDAALSAEAASREKPTAKVISIASTKKTPASSAAPSTPRLKRAAGDPMIPAHDDKRFSDV